MNKNLNNTLVETYFNEAIKDIQTIVRIPSFASKPEKDAPYGLAVKEVLEKTLEICNKLGFKTYKDPQNRYGYAEYGNGQKLFGIISHLDVVPSGDLNKWDFPPFSGEIDNNVLYGRGVLDDKGPAILNIYAIKYWMDQNWIPKKYTIRLIFGLTEETTWESIGHYIENEKAPDLGYTPDGEFPVIFAEKRIINFDLIAKQNTSLTINGGNAYNVVCDFVNLEDKSNNLKKEFKGTAAHGSTPEKGENAIFKVAKEYENSNLLILKLINSLWKNSNCNLVSIFENAKDDSGDFTANLGIIEVRDGYQRIGIDLRCPATFDEIWIENKIKNWLEKNYSSIEFKKTDHVKPIFLNQNDEFVQKILKVYKEVTGDKDAKPIAIGGGTYARAFDNVLAFGAAWDMDSMHSVNERVSIDDLKKMFLIYIKSLVEIVS